MTNFHRPSTVGCQTISAVVQNTVSRSEERLSKIICSEEILSELQMDVSSFLTIGESTEMVVKLTRWVFFAIGLHVSSISDHVLCCIVCCKNRVRSNVKQTLFVNTWKHSQACSWETEKTLRAVLPNQWVATNWWVAKIFQVGREAFLNVTVFY